MRFHGNHTMKSEAFTSQLTLETKVESWIFWDRLFSPGDPQGRMVSSRKEQCSLVQCIQ